MIERVRVGMLVTPASMSRVLMYSPIVAVACAVLDNLTFRNDSIGWPPTQPSYWNWEPRRARLLYSLGGSN